MFLSRFRETKERDVVIKKLQSKDFDQKNLQTILNYEMFKDYAILLQENHYFSRTEYLSMIKKENQRLMAQNNITADDLRLMNEECLHKKLSLNLDTFQYSQTKKLVQDQLRYIATAIRAEKTLRDHMYFMHQHQKEMKTSMEQAALLTTNYHSSLVKKDQEMMI